MNNKVQALENRLKKSGVDASLTPKIREREYLQSLLKELETVSSEDYGKLMKKIKNAQQKYSLVFHDHFAAENPHLLFERTEDKVWWVYQEDEGIYEEVRTNEARSRLFRLLRAEGMSDYATEAHARNILARYRADYFKRGKLYEEFDDADSWFHANNGWVSLETGKFIPHDPSRLSRRKSAVDFDPDAVCPVYDKFLDTDARLKKDEVRVLDQFSGLLLTHDIRHQKMLTIIGKPGSGKSTLLDTWSHVLGDLVTQNALTDFSGDKYRFMGSSLAGRTLCWFDEVEVKRAEMGSVLEKKITAQQIEIERKGIDGTRYSPNYLKFVLTANTLPLSAESGIYRRLMIIPFERSFTDDETVDRDIMDKLKAEAPGILNRMLKGLKDLQKMGTFTLIAGHDEKIERYKASSNTVAEFLDTYFEPVFGDPQGTTHERLETRRLFEAYNTWMGMRHGFQLTPQRFGQMLAAQPLSSFSHIETSRSKGARYWTGLRLQEDYEWHESEDGRWSIKELEVDNNNTIRPTDVDF